MIRRVLAVSDLGALVADRGGGPGQRVEGVEQRGPVLFDRQDEVAALLVDEFGGGLDGVQDVCGDGRVA
jgi:hypothetical protein